jgi:hypothetical protein
LLAKNVSVFVKNVKEIVKDLEVKCGRQKTTAPSPLIPWRIQGLTSNKNTRQSLEVLPDASKSPSPSHGLRML